MPPVTGTAAPKSTPPLVIVLATVLAVIPILALAQIIAHARVDEFDAWLFAYYGRQMVRGHTLYAELWDNKPPGIFWLNALGSWLGGAGLTGIRVLCAGATCGAAAVVWAMAKRLYGWSAAALATVLAALYLNVWPYHVGCNRPGTFFVLTELACMGLYCRALSSPEGHRRSLRSAGRGGALSFCLMQTALAATAAVVLHTLYLAGRRRLSPRQACTRLLFFAEGWLTVMVLVVLALAWTSDLLSAWHAVVGFNRLYFLPEVGSSLVPPFFALELHLRVLALPLILAVATLVQPLLRRWLGGVPERDDDPVGARPPGLLFLLWAWMLGAIYWALIGPHRRLPYFGVALPPLVMLAVHGVNLLLRSGRRRADAQPAYHVIVGVLWMVYMMVFPLHEQVVEAGKQYYHRFMEAPDRAYLETVAAVQRSTQPDETLFVFGYGPKLYWDADRPSAIRYIGTEKAGQLGRYGQPLFDEISDLLMQAQPKVIVVDPGHFDHSPFVKGLDTSRVEVWLHTHYQPPSEGCPKDVWIRRE